MGSPPPPDAPSPEAQALLQQNASFEPAPTGFELCGFGLPFLSIGLAFRIPNFPPFPIPPTFNFALALKCDLSDPLDASFEFGGGRQSLADEDQFEAA